MPAADANVMTESARPKVNLTLRVLGKRPDGYHALESLVAFARKPADVLTLHPGDTAGVTVSGPGASAILGENLIARALRLLVDAEPRLRLGALHLEKHLPVAAGIGGGSADAAAVLRLVRRANPDIASSVDWQAVALKLGADVPVCVDSEAAFMWGIGERIASLPGLPALPAVVVNPMVPVPTDKTAQVFRRLGAGPLASVSEPSLPGPFGSAQDVVTYMREIGNDLEAPAMTVVPEIATVKSALAASAGCILAQQSGGGPTCFGIFVTDAAAEQAAVALMAANPAWWIAATVLG